ncbi:MAG: glutaminyl-peptide cyclotransferase [Planctomycetota bacterium]
MNSPKSRAERRREEREERSNHSEPTRSTPPGAGRRGVVIVVLGALVVGGLVFANLGQGPNSATPEDRNPPPVANATDTPTQPSTPKPEKPAFEVHRFRIVESYPHDRTSYTQGLVFHDGQLYEGTGHRGQSLLARVDLKTGRHDQVHRLGSQYFGEGIAIWKETIFQLTWQSGVVFAYDLKTFEETGRFRIDGEGWGLTHDGTHLILSDGTDQLRFLDPKTLKVVRRLAVTGNGLKVPKLNELEYINGEIYANIWQTDVIARISPKDGKLIGWINLAGLLPFKDRKPPPGQNPPEVLNGIAYDEKNQRLFVTGKWWPKLFHIELVK